ncbi:MAG: hypothetical protein DDT19_00061 [Syntrophomonadaceae bacterium]|nr:hypothetical protein [Bacillota bacterium]
MRISLIDFDSKPGFPNLALMKLSTYLKEQGHEVGLNKMRADAFYVSVIFDWHREKLEKSLLPYCANVEVGGTGWNLEKSLPPEVENCPADYSLYGIDYGIGFTSRGCIRHCPFCVVPRKEGYIRPVADVAELINPKSNFLILLDNNLLASPNCRQVLSDIKRLNLSVNFNQGLDIRLIDDEIAYYLSQIKARDWKNKNNRLYFSFDNPDIKNKVQEGVALLGQYRIRPSRLMFYMLCNFDTTFEEDYYRFQILDRLGCKPFVMVYKSKERKAPPITHAFARWVNKRYYKICSWPEYRDPRKNRETPLTELLWEGE